MKAEARTSVGTHLGEAAQSYELRLTDGAKHRARDEYRWGVTAQTGDKQGALGGHPQPGSLLPPFCQQEPYRLPTFSLTLHFPINPYTPSLPSLDTPVPTSDRHIQPWRKRHATLEPGGLLISRTASRRGPTWVQSPALPLCN